MRVTGWMFAVIGLIVFRDGFDIEMWTVSTLVRSCFLAVMLVILIDMCHTYYEDRNKEERK